MSAPASKDFVDHYQVLEVDPRATTDTIQAAYERLAKRYAPGNSDTGDSEKFAAVNRSFDVLIDPSLRQAFDQVRGGTDGDSSVEFPVEEFVAGLGGDTARRLCLLSLLCYRRKYTPVTPGISLRQAESAIDTTMDDLAFNIWYLKQKGLVASDDKSRLQITVSGIEYVEKANPTVEVLRSALRSPEVRQKMEAAQAARQTQQESAKAPPQESSKTPPPPSRPGIAGSPNSDPGSLRSLGAALDKSQSQSPAPSPTGRAQLPGRPGFSSPPLPSKPPDPKPSAASKPEETAPTPSRRFNLAPKLQR